MAIASMIIGALLVLNTSDVITLPDRRNAQEFGNIVAEMILLILVGLLCKLCFAGGLRRLKQPIVNESNLLDDDLD